MLAYLPDEVRFLRRGTGPRDRLTLARIVAHMHLRTGRARRLTQVMPEGPSPELEVSLDGGALSLRLRSCDGVVVQIMGAGVLDVPLEPLGRVETVLDLGAHVGIAAIELSRKLPDARFACVEPVQSSFRLLEVNLRRNLPNSFALRAAVVAEPGPQQVLPAPNPAMSQVVAARPGATDVVDGLTVEGVLERAGWQGADLVKLDIEGGEAALLEPAAWSQVGAVLAEIHAPLTADEAADALASQGFHRLSLPPDRRFERTLLMSRRTGGGT